MDDEDLLLLPSLLHPNATPWAREIFCLALRGSNYSEEALLKILALLPCMDQEDAEEAARVIAIEGRAIIAVSTYAYCVSMAKKVARWDIPMDIERVGYEQPFGLLFLSPDDHAQKKKQKKFFKSTSRHLPDRGSQAPFPTRTSAGTALSIVALHHQENMTSAGIMTALIRYGMSYTQAMQCAGMVALNGSCIIKRQIGPPLPKDHGNEFLRAHGYTLSVTTIHLPFA